VADLVLIPGVLALGSLLVLAVSTVRYTMADETGRAVLRKGWRIRASWRRTALRCGLYQADQAAPAGGEMLMMRSRDKVLIPRIKVTPAANGLTVTVKTVGQVGLAEFERAAEDLANAWRVRYVTASPSRPGYLKLRITLRDALRIPTDFAVSPDAPVDLNRWQLGHDRQGDLVVVRTSNVSGIIAAGLAGTGKTALVRHRFVTLAPSPLVQFGLIDGKDFELADLAPRAWLHCGDDITRAHFIVKQFHTLMVERQALIRSVLHRKNFWSGLPALQWPLAKLVMDEAHTYLFESKFKDKANQDRDALVREIVWMCDELVRKGRALGIQCMFLTQKPTGESIPTKIRDNCQIAMSFAQRSTEAAKAALGDDINDYPHAHPRRLQDPAYTGVLSVMAEGRPGYTLVRNPYTSDTDAADLAEATRHLVRDPLADLRALAGDLHPVADLQDAPA
jgi:S-DNA-T family DNA segregation ATPase FtsK/SpoIIIE